ncbi:MAG TPA: glycine--tRNA ligase, partial [Candidatus Atribacteria bacterium]|nr:glycine--tRNA ligase [Candidatus Atribacteria bacterium]
NIVGLDSAILMNSRVWKASGHLTAGFADLLVECKKCHKRFKGDEVRNICPECGGELTKPKKFNLMMKTFAGPVEEESSLVYLRAETTQGIYVNFKNVLNSMRLKVPFGIAQIGKAFRNEINPRNFIYRTREFEQMEMEWFCHPKDASMFFNQWKEERIKWYQKLGIKKENLRIKEISKKELPHYAKQGADIEYRFPFGWGELEAIHNRGDWDLSNHSKFSGQDLSYLDPDTGERYFPYIVETSGGIDRSVLAFLSEAYHEVKGGRTKTTKATKEVEVLLRLSKELAPIKIAVLPLVKNKKDLVKKAKEIYKNLKIYFRCQYDEVGSIGRRYRRQDEIGTLFAVTVDFETLKQKDVTVRDRNTMKQERVKIKDLVEFFKKKIEG